MKKIIAYMTILTLVLTFVGCRPARRDIPEERDIPAERERDIGFQNATDYDLDGYTRPQELENRIEAETALKDVIVVTRGQEVFVGIDMDENQDYGPNVVQRIEEIVKEDQRYTYVYVTNENNTVEALRVIREEIVRGNDVEYYNDELNSIRDLMNL